MKSQRFDIVIKAIYQIYISFFFCTFNRDIDMGQIPKESLIKADEVYKKIENGKVNKW